MAKPDMKRLEKERIGFIGLGLMGKPMARNLLAAGADLYAWNRSAGPAEEISREGATLAPDPAALARELPGGVLILMLKNTEAVAAVVDGDNGLLSELAPGTLVIDMGTTGLAETRAWAAAAADRGVAWIDAPVSGGQVGAVNATLSIMVGGTQEAYRRALPILEVLGAAVTYLGPSGAGQITKLANQIIVANTLAAVAEAFLLARAARADLEAVRTALLGGFASSRILDLHGQRMIREDYEPGGKATGQLKDALEGVKTMTEAGLKLPMLAANAAVWQQMVDDGLGELDHSAIFEFYKKIQSET